jgi:hypothetical protein
MPIDGGRDRDVVQRPQRKAGYATPRGAADQDEVAGVDDAADASIALHVHPEGLARHLAYAKPGHVPVANPGGQVSKRERAVHVGEVQAGGLPDSAGTPQDVARRAGLHANATTATLALLQGRDDGLQVLVVAVDQLDHAGTLVGVVISYSTSTSSRIRSPAASAGTTKRTDSHVPRGA